MYRKKLLVVTAACAFLAPFRVAGAQQLPTGRPTPSQAQELLKSRPDLVARLRQEISVMQLSPAQVRARLREEGYPENMLDAYLPGAGAQPDSLPASLFEAVRALGIVDTSTFGMMLRGTPYEELLVTADGGAARRTTAPPDRDGRGSLAPTVAARRSDVFGMELFARDVGAFEPNLAGPVGADYRLGPGDKLVLLLTGDVERSHELDVTREGFVVVPQVGTVAVANLTVDQVKNVLYDRLSRVYSGVTRLPNASTRFELHVAGLHVNQVTVIGEVFSPRSVRVASTGTAFTALLAAGGPTEAGSMRRIEIRRSGRPVSTLDLYDYLLRGDGSQDPRLENGDVVFVPVHGSRVSIVGEVTRPATYELKPGETLTDLVRAAGGFTPSASRQRIQIERIVPPAQRVPGGRDRQTIDVESDQVGATAGPAIALEPGDAVRVFRVADKVRGRVRVTGNVWAPGLVGITPGMGVEEAIRSAGGVKPDVYLGQILITRIRPDSSSVQLRSAFRDSSGAVLVDVPLQEDDEVRVFSVSTFRPDRFVRVSGAVHTGGRFAYHEGMTLRDAVLLAGGLHESASLQNVEIARMPATREGGQTATTFRVPIDSTYLFERQGSRPYIGPPGLPASVSSAPEVELRPYDNVLILRQPDWALQRVVIVSGEVRFPGPYSLRVKNERLADILQRAGGLTSEGHADGVVFSRPRSGRIGVDLPRVLRDPSRVDNLILQDGDSIFVPQFNAVVSIMGAVNSPVAVPFVEGKDLSFYLRAGGGPTGKADVNRAYVRQPNGTVESTIKRTLFPDSHPKPRPGSTVIVPEREPTDRRDYAATFAAVAQVVVGLVGIVALLTR